MLEFVIQSDDENVIDSTKIANLPDVVAVGPRPQTAGGASFESAELAALDLLIKLASAGAVTAAVTGIFNLLVERQKGRNQPVKIKAGDLEMEIPPGQPPEALKALAAPLGAYLSKPRPKPAVITIDAGD